MNVIYALHTADQEYRYIGVTGDLQKRMYAHRSSAKTGSKLPVHCWMRKYPGEVSATVIDVCDTFDQALAMETYWIESAGIDTLLNLSAGGSAPMIGRKHTDEAKAKISAALKGNQRTKGRKLTDEHIAKVSEARTGTKHSAETKAKMSESLKGNQRWLGRKHTDEERAKISKSPAGIEGRARGLHTQWHTNRGITKPGCRFCE